MILISLFLYLYIVTISWSGTFSIGSWLPLHVLFLTIATGLYLPKLILTGRLPRHIYPSEDILLCFGLIAIVITGLLHQNEKTMNYWMAYFFVFGVGYFGLKLLLYKNTSTDKLLTINMLAVLFISTFALVELISNKFFGVDIQNYLTRVKPATATFNVHWPRSYGLATEPTILCYYLNTLGPIAIWQLWDLKSIPWIFKPCMTIIAILGWICTFSAAGIIFLPVSICFVLIIVFVTKLIHTVQMRCHGNSYPLYLKLLLGISQFCLVMITSVKRRLCRKTIITGISICLLFWALIAYTNAIQSITRPILAKVTLKVPSAQERVKRWKTAITEISSHPVFGRGPGWLSSQGNGSSANWYLFLTLESGLVGAIPFILFLLLSLRRIAISNEPSKYWFLTCFVAGSLHLCVISTIHHPFLWVLMAIFLVTQEKNRLIHPTHEPQHD